MSLSPWASLYIHVPFCPVRCDYCDFFSSVRLCESGNFRNYLDLVEHQLVIQKKNYGLDELKTIFIGGGSPSSLGMPNLEALLVLIATLFPYEISEYTMECNPCDISLPFLKLLQKYKINRISLGIQSFQNRLLLNVGRRSTREINLSAIQILADHWTGEWSLDLMFALPEQSLEDLATDLQELVRCNPPHVSTYELDWEKGTRLYTKRNKFIKSSAALKQKMYRHIVSFLRQNGYHHYEVSNFCKPGHYSRHNSVYWRLQPYAAAGPGAVMMTGFDGHNAYRRSTYSKPEIHWRKSLEKWIKKPEKISRYEYIFEILFMGLRTSRGANLNRILKLSDGVTVEQILNIASSFPGKLNKKNDFLVCTESGLEILNHILHKYYLWKEKRLH